MEINVKNNVKKQILNFVFITGGILLLILLYFKYSQEQQNRKQISNALTEKYGNDIVLSDYILLKSYNVNDSDKGGFYWWVHQVACLVKLGEMTNKKVLVYLDDGYYKDDEREEESWWSYFFKYPKLTAKNLDMIHASEQIGYTEVLSSKLKPSDKMYLFTNKTFQNVMRHRMGDINKIYKRFLKINNEVVDECREFLYDNNIVLGKDVWMIGVHYRGTDKFFGNGDKEDMIKNKHITYEEVVEKLESEIKKAPKDKKIYIYAASDEQPFVDKITKEFGEMVISYGAFRADVSTSGVELPDTTKTKTGANTELGRKLKEMADLSVHRGDNGVPGYKKGVDAIIDVWMLSNCNVFIKTLRGNFSSQPKKWNNSLKVIEMKTK